MHLGMRKQRMTGLLGKGLEVLYRSRVGGHDLQHLPGLNVGKRLLGAQDGQRTVQAARIDFLLVLHAVQIYHAADCSEGFRRRPRTPKR